MNVRLDEFDMKMFVLEILPAVAGRVARFVDAFKRFGMRKIVEGSDRIVLIVVVRGGVTPHGAYAAGGGDLFRTAHWSLPATPFCRSCSWPD